VHDSAKMLDSLSTNMFTSGAWNSSSSPLSSLHDVMASESDPYSFLPISAVQKVYIPPFDQRNYLKVGKPLPSVRQECYNNLPQIKRDSPSSPLTSYHSLWYRTDRDVYTVPAAVPVQSAFQNAENIWQQMLHPFGSNDAAPEVSFHEGLPLPPAPVEEDGAEQRFFRSLFSPRKCDLVDFDEFPDQLMDEVRMASSSDSASVSSNRTDAPSARSVESGEPIRKRSVCQVDKDTSPPSLPPKKLKSSHDGDQLRPSVAASELDGGTPTSGEGGDGSEGKSWEDLIPFLHVPIEEASKHLNMRISGVRNVCRRYGVKRWPYRRIGCLRKMQSGAEKILASNRANVDKAAVQATIANIRDVFTRLRTDAAILDDDTTINSLRQQLSAACCSRLTKSTDESLISKVLDGKYTEEDLKDDPLAMGPVIPDTPSKHAHDHHTGKRGFPLASSRTTATTTTIKPQPDSTQPALVLKSRKHAAPLVAGKSNGFNPALFTPNPMQISSLADAAATGPAKAAFDQKCFMTIHYNPKFRSG